jgi:hypothetical protein
MDHVNFRSRVQRWLHAAKIWLSGPLEKDRLSISGIQIHCLTILARQVYGIGGDLAWTSTGALVQQAMLIGLHCDPRHLPPVLPVQAEIRWRFWAMGLELAVKLSLDTAMLPKISLDEFDTWGTGSTVRIWIGVPVFSCLMLHSSSPKESGLAVFLICCCLWDYVNNRCIVLNYSDIVPNARNKLAPFVRSLCYSAPSP